MVRVLLDACVPHGLRKHLSGVEVETAYFAGLDQISDGALLDAIEGRFDVLVTLDRNLVYQQKIGGRPVSVIVFRVQNQTPEAFLALVPVLREAIAEAKPGEVRIIGP
jgi:predicted nuclease of predicted toxin-antitoxin system